MSVQLRHKVATALALAAVGTATTGGLAHAATVSPSGERVRSVAASTHHQATPTKARAAKAPAARVVSSARLTARRPGWINVATTTRSADAATYTTTAALRSQRRAVAASVRVRHVYAGRVLASKTDQGHRLPAQLAHGPGHPRARQARRPDPGLGRRRRQEAHRRARDPRATGEEPRPGQRCGRLRLPGRLHRAGHRPAGHRAAGGRAHPGPRPGADTGPDAGRRPHADPDADPHADAHAGRHPHAPGRHPHAPGHGPPPVNTPTDVPSTAKLVFAHYFPPFPISIDNVDPSNDYYARNYLTIDGENGKYAQYGGFLRDRPVPRQPLARPGLAGRGPAHRGPPGQGRRDRRLHPQRAHPDRPELDRRGQPDAGREGRRWLHRRPQPRRHRQRLDTASPDVADKLAELYAYPSAQKVDGEYLMSSFAPENRGSSVLVRGDQGPGDRTTTCRSSSSRSSSTPATPT